MRIQVTDHMRIQVPDPMRIQVPDHMMIQVPDHMRIQVPDHMRIQVPDHMRIQLVDEFQVLSAQILLSLELFLCHVLKIFIFAIKFLAKIYNNSRLKVVARTFVKSFPKLAKCDFL
jgi:hypothetical protein